MMLLYAPMSNPANENGNFRGILIAVGMTGTIAGVSILFGIIASHGSLSEMVGSLASSGSTEGSVSSRTQEPGLPTTTIPKELQAPESGAQGESASEKLNSAPADVEQDTVQTQTAGEPVQTVPADPPADTLNNGPHNTPSTGTHEGQVPPSGSTPRNNQDTEQDPAVQPATDDDKQSKDKDEKGHDKKIGKDVEKLEKAMQEKLKQEKKDTNELQKEGKEELKHVEIHKVNGSIESGSVFDLLFDLFSKFQIR